MPTFKKTWSEIRLPNKDYKVLINYAPNCTATFTNFYNTIAGTYLGLFADCGISTLRGLLRACPEFMETISDQSDLDKELTLLGFEKVEMPERKATMYKMLNPA